MDTSFVSNVSEAETPLPAGEEQSGQRRLTFQDITNVANPYDLMKKEGEDIDLYMNDEVLVRKKLQEKWKEKNAKLKEIYKK